eukprot:Gb_33887 [translate_table: standard]
MACMYWDVGKHNQGGFSLWVEDLHMYLSAPWVDHGRTSEARESIFLKAILSWIELGSDTTIKVTRVSIQLGSSEMCQSKGVIRLSLGPLLLPDSGTTIDLREEANGDDKKSKMDNSHHSEAIGLLGCQQIFEFAMSYFDYKVSYKTPLCL